LTSSTKTLPAKTHADQDRFHRICRCGFRVKAEGLDLFKLLGEALELVSVLYRPVIPFLCFFFPLHRNAFQKSAKLIPLEKLRKSLSIRSGHGTGKTTTLAIITVHHALTKFLQAVVATAPTSSQLFDALAAQTKSWFKKLPAPLQEMFEIKSESITHKLAPEDSFVSFRTSRPEMPEALAGVHSDHVLLIGDEASGIPEAVYVAASGSMSSRARRVCAAPGRWR
jgi:hypothetical protein